MRIAVSGAHAVGKSTLVAELAASVPDYELIEEPYYYLMSEGVAFSDHPTVQDFELQLERSLALLASHKALNALFDRCPADYLGYLTALRNTSRETLTYWLRPSAEALAALDLVVFVPVERPDRINVTDAEMPGLRKRVDLALRQILIDDDLGLSLEVVEVHGSTPVRVRQVLEHLGRV